MDKTYSPIQIENKWYKNWENAGYFKPQINSEAGGEATTNDNENYCIVIPPPNVTGSLHMGHAFQDTIMDCLIRYQRMLGKNTLWQAGTDHAGIATQIVVQNKIEKEENKTKHDYGREAFVEKIWQWKEESGGNISNQLRRLGASADWSRERFTMDEGLSNAVKEVFVRLHKEGLIYRGKRLVNWDPILKTAISDLEVINHEEDGFMYYVRYPFVAGQGKDGEYMHIATTRPETILADGALAVHPNDERYKDVIGKMVHVPMTDRIIPIIVDEYPDPEFGSGCVKITPAHDFNDYQVGQRHEMEIINLFTPDAIMNESAPKKYQGMDRFVARDAIVIDLDNAGLLEKTEAHKMTRPRGDRTNTVIEPYLTDQWYVKTDSLAKTAIEAVETGAIEFVPKQYENMYFSWMRDIKDWCISRQLWWGHRIPAWYDEDGNVYVGRNEDEVRSENNLDENLKLNQDEDVLDTWFSSALWTFSTLGWPENTKELKLFHPTNVLVTGFDIIFFWVARMIMMTMHFIKDENGKPQVPFKTVYVTGLIRDENGDKMSKSKGNVLDPLDMIDGIDIETLVEKRTSNLMSSNPKQAEKIAKATRTAFPKGIEAHGTDALRFTLASLASTGRDINWDMNRLEGYRNFCNKLWNAARFVLMNVEDKDCGANKSLTDFNLQKDLRVEERWILSESQLLFKEINVALAEYRFDIAAQAMYHFTWDTYCSWYLELAKTGLNDDSLDENTKITIRYVLIHVLDNLLRLMHPLMPFITEEIWQQIKPFTSNKIDSIMIAQYPINDEKMIDEQAHIEVSWLQSCLNGIRKVRSEMDIAPSKSISLLIENANEKDKLFITRHKNSLAKLAKLESVTIADKDIPESAMTLVGEMKLHIPLAGLIDKNAELERLSREINKLQQSVDRLSGQLNNKAYADKAPAHLVEQTKKQLVEQQQTLDNLNEQKEKVSKL